jgi:hypothetical protein
MTGRKGARACAAAASEFDVWAPSFRINGHTRSSHALPALYWPLASLSLACLSFGFPSLGVPLTRFSLTRLSLTRLSLTRLSLARLSLTRLTLFLFASSLCAVARSLLSSLLAHCASLRYARWTACRRSPTRDRCATSCGPTRTTGWVGASRRVARATHSVSKRACNALRATLCFGRSVQSGCSLLTRVRMCALCVRARACVCMCVCVCVCLCVCVPLRK